jgi:hypothetical protein
VLIAELNEAGYKMQAYITAQPDGGVRIDHQIVPAGRNHKRHGMSNHERVYEGTLYWPLMMNQHGLICRCPQGESLPPWGLTEDDPKLPENPCAMTIIGQDYLTLDDIKEAVEQHMREAHGEKV